MTKLEEEDWNPAVKQKLFGTQGESLRSDRRDLRASLRGDSIQIVKIIIVHLWFSFVKLHGAVPDWTPSIIVVVDLARRGDDKGDRKQYQAKANGKQTNKPSLAPQHRAAHFPRFIL
jgi:hypothetical protein